LEIYYSTKISNERSQVGRPEPVREGTLLRHCEEPIKSFLFYLILLATKQSPVSVRWSNPII